MRSDAIVNALIRAHTRRKVSVRVVMDRLNANPSNPNFGVNRLEKALKVGNGKRKNVDKSFVRKCVSACRAQRGIAHTKFYLFSKAGKARNIIMYGSANATDLAAGAQWNDLYTIRRDRDDLRRVRQRLQGDDAGHATSSSLTSPTPRRQQGSRCFYPYKGRGHREGPDAERAQPTWSARARPTAPAPGQHQDPDRHDVDAR